MARSPLNRPALRIPLSKCAGSAARSAASAFAVAPRSKLTPGATRIVLRSKSTTTVRHPGTAAMGRGAGAATSAPDDESEAKSRLYPSAISASPTVGSTSPAVSRAARSAAATASSNTGPNPDRRPSRGVERRQLRIGDESASRPDRTPQPPPRRRRPHARAPGDRSPRPRRCRRTPRGASGPGCRTPWPREAWTTTRPRRLRRRLRRAAERSEAAWVADRSEEVTAAFAAAPARAPGWGPAARARSRSPARACWERPSPPRPSRRPCSSRLEQKMTWPRACARAPPTPPAQRCRLSTQPRPR